jgi:GNAT superfamily N-acetyltransferase
MLRIRTMAVADLPVAMRLKEQAGWNQVEADWWRLIAMQPDGCFVAELDGAVVGTTVACVFDSVAWLAMVLVEATVRGRGIGSALVEHALAYADGRSVKTVRLDATPLGQPLYEKQGFVAQFKLTRYAGAPQSGERFPHEKEEVELAADGMESFDEITVLDRSVTNINRARYLRRLFDENPSEVRVARRSGELAGYLLSRPGSNAVQIGPCIAVGVAGELLLADAAHRLVGQRVYLDVPTLNDAAVRTAERFQFEPQRQLTRMYRGIEVVENAMQLWASSGPALG